MKISAVILTKNEEKNISDCIKTLDYFDEIIIVDDFSTDGTMAEIDKFKDDRIKIFQNNLNDNFSNQRNFALSKASNRYVFFIDADERVGKNLEEELRLIDENFDGYYIRRKDNIWEKELNYGEVGNIFILRLGNKEKGKWVGKVHEKWEIKGKIRRLRNPLYHFPHQTISEFLREINYYSTLRSEELYSQGVRSGLLAIIFYTKGKFIFDFFVKQGFRDGIPGFILAMFMSFHSFLVRGKLWQFSQKE